MAEALWSLLGSSTGYIVGWIVALFIFRWILTIVRVAKDIHMRSRSMWLQLLSVLLVTVMTPLLWLPFYRVIRPVAYLYDKTPWRQSILKQHIRCPWCSSPVNITDKHCNHCGVSLQVTCRECGQHYAKTHHYCHHCCCEASPERARGLIGSHFLL